MKKLFASTKIGGGKAAVGELQGGTSASVEHIPCVPAGCRTSEFHASNPVSLVAQALDRAHDGVGLAGIHRGSANHRHVNPSPGGDRRKREIDGTERPLVLISDGSQNAQRGGS